MRQRFIITSLVAVLLSGGWGGIIAAAMACPHAGGRSPAAEVEETPSVGKESPSCCPLEAGESQHCPMTRQGARAGAPDNHHAASAEYHVTPRGEETARQSPRPAATVDGAAARNAQALVQSTGHCSFCSARPGPPQAPVNAPDAATRRDGDGHAARARGVLLPAVLASFTPSVVPLQGAPPGGNTTRHLLYSVFLI